MCDYPELEGCTMSATSMTHAQQHQIEKLVQVWGVLESNAD